MELRPVRHAVLRHGQPLAGVVGAEEKRGIRGRAGRRRTNASIDPTKAAGTPETLPGQIIRKECVFIYNLYTLKNTNPCGS
jgi:hypothetical protein